MALTGPPQEVMADTGQRHYTRGFVAATALQIWEISADILRAVWLLILFLPLAATATLSLQHGIRREEWLVYLRRASLNHLPLPSAGSAMQSHLMWQNPDCSLEYCVLIICPGVNSGHDCAIVT